MCGYLCNFSYLSFSVFLPHSLYVTTVLILCVSSWLFLPVRGRYISSDREREREAQKNGESGAERYTANQRKGHINRDRHRKGGRCRQGKRGTDTQRVKHMHIERRSNALAKKQTCRDCNRERHTKGRIQTCRHAYHERDKLTLKTCLVTYIDIKREAHVYLTFHITTYFYVTISVCTALLSLLVSLFASVTVSVYVSVSVCLLIFASPYSYLYVSVAVSWIYISLSHSLSVFGCLSLCTEQNWRAHLKTEMNQTSIYRDECIETCIGTET